MKIIRESQIIDSEGYSLDFMRDFGGGYSHPCDADGTMHPFENEAQRSNYELHLELERKGEVKRSIRHWERSYREPAIGRCACGREVWLDGFTCPCDCGRDYNSSGQLLAPREQWGEETGEHWTECM